MLILFLILYLSFNYCDGVKCPILEVTNTSSMNGVYEMTNINLEWAPDKPVFKQLKPGQSTRFEKKINFCCNFPIYRYIRIYNSSGAWNGRWVISPYLDSTEGWFWSKWKHLHTTVTIIAN